MVGTVGFEFHRSEGGGLGGGGVTGRYRELGRRDKQWRRRG